MSTLDRIDPPMPSLSSADISALLVAHAMATSDADLPRALGACVGRRRAARVAARLERGETLGSALVAERWASATEGALLDQVGRADLPRALERLRERAVGFERMLGRLRWALAGPALLASIPLALRTWTEYHIAREIQLEMLGKSETSIAVLVPMAAVWLPILALGFAGYMAGARWWFDVVGRFAGVGTVARGIADWHVNTGRALPGQLGLGVPAFPVGSDPVALALAVAGDVAATERHATELETDLGRATAAVGLGATLLVSLVVCYTLLPTIGSPGFVQMFAMLERLG